MPLPKREGCSSDRLRALSRSPKLTSDLVVTIMDAVRHYKVDWSSELYDAERLGFEE